MEFITENWALIVALVAAITAGVVAGIKFYNMPTDKQLNIPQEKLLNPADWFHFKLMTTDRWMLTKG